MALTTCDVTGGARLHHVRVKPAGIDDGVVHARVARDVLAHVVDPDIHQFDGVERAAAKVGRCRRM
jgi:hypothetical protein